MDQRSSRQDVLTQETKRLQLRSPPVLPTSSDDITGTAEVDAAIVQAISMRVSQNKGQVTPDPNSTISPISSTDTFVTAPEQAESKEDPPIVEENLILSRSASPSSTDIDSILTSTQAVATPNNERGTQNPKVVFDNFAGFSLISRSLQDDHAKLTTTTAKPQTDTKDVNLPVIKSSSFQQRRVLAPPHDTLQNNCKPPAQTRNAANLNPSLPTILEDDMTGGSKKHARGQTCRERTDLAVLSSVEEDDSVHKVTTDHDPSNDSTNNSESLSAAALHTGSTESQNEDMAPTRTRSTTSPTYTDHTLTQYTTTSCSSQVFNSTGVRVAKDSRYGSFLGHQSRRGKMTANLLAEPWLFTYDHEHRMTNCWLGGCSQPTKSSDGRTVSCPRCGDRSYVRYCSVSHLLLDMRDHYITACGKRMNLLRMDESTIPPVRQPSQGFIRASAQQNDSSERHRQALYHAYPPESEITTSTRPAADYYIFSDADRFQVTDLAVTRANLDQFRCTGSIAGRVRYEQIDPRKALFRTLLERLLVLGTSAGRVNPKGCRMLFMWIKENLEGQGEWTEIMITRMCLATQLEFGWNVEVELRE